MQFRALEGKRAAIIAAGGAAVACAVATAVFAARPRYDIKSVRMERKGTMRAGVVYHPRRWFRWRHPGILFCHGMLPKGKDTALYARLMHQLARRGYLVACFDMPGFGESRAEGATIADLDLVADVEAALTYMLRYLLVDKDTVTIAGHSCGANPAFAVGAGDRRVKNIVVLSAGNFSPAAGSDPAAAKNFVNRWWLETGLKVPLSDAMRIGKTLYLFQYLPLDPLKNVLVVAAENEWPWVVEYNRRLYDALNVRKNFLVVPRSKHNLGYDARTGNILIDPAPSRLVAAAIDEWLKSNRWYRECGSQR